MNIMNNKHPIDITNSAASYLHFSIHYKSPGTIGSIVVCISPLTSLMMDQQHMYSPKGLRTQDSQW